MKKQVTKAIITDHKLIVHLPSADESMLWVADLSQVSSKGLKIRLKEEEGVWILGLEKDASGFQEMGRFQDKDKAVEALEAVSKTLFKGESGFAKTTLRVLGFGLGGVMGVAIVLIAVFKGLALLAPHGSSVVAQVPSSGMVSPEASDAIKQYGIPLSADEILTPPQ